VKFKEARGRRQYVHRQPNGAARLDVLGYSEDETTAIIDYIDEHKTIVGAPALKVEHLPIFACSMGDKHDSLPGSRQDDGRRAALYLGGDLQDVNMPEDVTIEDVEKLHMDAWRLGVKPSPSTRKTAR